MMTGRNDWMTPRELFDACTRAFGPFALDVAATRKNTMCERFCETTGGLIQPWAPSFWCNPPYTFMGTKVIGDWVRKAVCEAKAGASGVMLLVNDPSTAWFADVQRAATTIAFLVGPRVQFGDPTGRGRTSPTGSHLVAHFTPQGAANQRVLLWCWRDDPLPAAAPTPLPLSRSEALLARIAHLEMLNETQFERYTAVRRELQERRVQRATQQGAIDD
jgi:phage N-6-adenine-methyltransferase